MAYIRYNQTPKVRTRINEQIRVPEVFLVDETGTAKGATPIATALDMARVAGLDLVEISPNAKPPVAKILDYGKWQYEQTKALKRQKLNQKEGLVKEVRLSVRIGEHDMAVKAGHATRFLAAGNKVKVSLMFRGREIVHQELGIDILNRFVDRLAEIAKIEQAPIKQGRSVYTILVAK